MTNNFYDDDNAKISCLFKYPDLGLTDEVNRVIEAFRLEHLADEEAKNLSHCQKKLLDSRTLI